ncbi:hypothetical protein MTR67_040122 [Solanum verrucosum]|uniref:Uncharacterized protein n=1 Tax=Solanum verrucosum TaxID=315347 RepID=A0AAF0UIQ4_SOLVR|nr:hypothetical protein MTR67_040122 [Solanum verrucosum]
MFNVLLKTYICDPNFVVPLESVFVKESLSYKEVPVEIFNRQVQNLRNKEVSSVKVFWKNQLVKGSTWYAKDDMMSKYPISFPPFQS